MGDDENDVIMSQELMGHSGALASTAILDLFVVHGRRPFHPDSPGLDGYPRWSGRGMRQQFAKAISEMHVAGYIRWLPGGRYKIVTSAIMTAGEFRAAYPDAEWGPGGVTLTPNRGDQP